MLVLTESDALLLALIEELWPVVVKIKPSVYGRLKPATVSTHYWATLIGYDLWLSVPTGTCSLAVERMRQSGCGKPVLVVAFLFSEDTPTASGQLTLSLLNMYWQA